MPVTLENIFRILNNPVYFQNTMVGNELFRNFAKFTGKQLWQSLFFKKVAGFRPATLLKNSLWHRCFPMNFATFLSCFCSPRVTFHHFFRAVYACRLFNQRSVSVYCIQNARDILVKLDHTFKFTIYNNISIIKHKIGLFENWKREEKHPCIIQNSLH